MLGLIVDAGGRAQFEPRERLGKLRCTLAELKLLQDGSSRGMPSQNFPEVYIGPAPNYPLLVNRAWKRMRKDWREVVEAHYVYSRIKIKQRIWALGLSTRDYWQHLNYGKNFIHSYVIVTTEPDEKVITTQNTLVNA